MLSADIERPGKAVATVDHSRVRDPARVAVVRLTRQLFQHVECSSLSSANARAVVTGRLDRFIIIGLIQCSNNLPTDWCFPQGPIAFPAPSLVLF